MSLYLAPFAVVRAHPLELARRTWAEAGEDNIHHAAAGIAFYVFLAMVPTLGATVLVYALLADPAAISRYVLALFHALPPDAAELIASQLRAAIAAASEKKGIGLFVALALALYSARQGADALMSGLNIANGVHESRGFLRRTAVALGITLGMVTMMLAGAGIGAGVDLVEQALAWPRALAWLPGFGGFIVAQALLAGVAAGACWLGTSGTGRRFAWLTPGSLLTALGWSAATSGFQAYVTGFGRYDATYGSLGAIVILLTWLWISAWLLLLGAELDSEIEALASAQHAARPDRPGTSTPNQDFPTEVKSTNIVAHFNADIKY